MSSKATQRKNEGMEQCIQNCTDCHRICLELVTHCLQLGGKHAEASHIRLLLDCAQVCATSADFMIRGSDLHGYTCGACAEVCARCAEDCEGMAEGNELMLRCAEICRRCAESCRQMAA
jgi:hypothetical protein